MDAPHGVPAPDAGRRYVATPLNAADRDAVLLALAILSLDRPGWLSYLRDIAARIFFEDPRVLAAQVAEFDEFRRLNADRFNPEATDPRRV